MKCTRLATWTMMIMGLTGCATSLVSKEDISPASADRSLSSSKSAPPAALPQTAPSNASEEISKIIYSDLTKSEMLNRLAVFVRIGDKLDDVYAKTGLGHGFCFGGGPGVNDCSLSGGLELVVDPDGVIQIIRRRDRMIGDTSFKQMSISTNILRWNGYVRWYPE